MASLIREYIYIFLQLIILCFLCEVSHAASTEPRNMTSTENITKYQRHAFDTDSFGRVSFDPDVQFVNSSGRGVGSKTSPFFIATGYKDASTDLHEYDILFLFIIFGLGALLRTLTFTFNLKMIYKVVLLLLGGLYGCIATQYESINNFTTIPKTHPRTMLLVFLPVVLFKTAYMLDAHSFLRAIWQILILGVLGFMISAVILGTAMMYMFDNHWNFEISLLFGIIASTIYPHEVVIALKELGRSKHLSILLEGEALIGCSTGIVLFHILQRKLVGILEAATRCMRSEGARFMSTVDCEASTEKITARIDIFLSVIATLCIEPVLGLIMGKLTTLMMSFVYNDPVTCITLTLVATFTTYIIADEVLGLAGPLAVVVLGIVISSERTNFPVEIDNTLNTFWEMLAYIANTFVLVVFGIIIVHVLYEEFGSEDIIMIILTYVVCVITRFIVFLILAPMLSRLGFGLPWRHGLIGAWGGLRGCVALSLALIVLRTDMYYKEGTQFMIHIAGVLLLTLLINGCTIQLMFKYLGMNEISLAKKTNMNNAMRYLESQRERATSMLKMDRFLADANWIVVEKYSHIKHPYKLKLEDDDNDDDNYLGYRFTTCPSCEKEILNEPTPQEYQEMMKEARMRILKAKKVSYWRQFEHGMISKDGVRVLVTAVDVSTDRDDPVMEVADICIVWEQSKQWTAIRKKLVNMMTSGGNEYQKPPREQWRVKFYRIAKNKWFDILIYIAIFLNTIPIMIEIFINPLSGTPLNIALKVLNSMFFLLYFAEFLIKVFAYYFLGYFKSHWNKFDLTILAIAVVDLVMDYLDLMNLFDKVGSVASTVTTATKLLRILRLLRLLRLLRASLPKAIAFVDSRVDAQMSLGYDVGKGFVTGEEEITKVLPQIADNKKIFDELKAKIDDDRLSVTRQLGLMQRDRPWIAITVKSRQAIRSILNSLRGTIYELKEGGLLDEVEYNKLMVVLEDQLKYLATHLSVIEPCPPEVLLKEVPWIMGDEITSAFLLEHAVLVTFNFGDQVIKDGDMPTAIYILVSGLVKLSYIPKDMTLETLNTYGALPNIDFFTSLRFDEKQEDYVVSGNVIGELGALTGRTYDVTMTCESSVQAYEIPITVMHEAFKLGTDPSQGMEARMWKALAHRLAAVILLNVPTYQSWSQEKLKFHLERAFVPRLDNLRMFVVNDYMEDVILIEGQVMDASNRIIYVAPCYIPRTVHRLLFPHSSLMNVKTPITTKLLIIPANDVDEYDIMETELGGQMIMTSSSKCLQHSVKSRISSQTASNRKLKTRGRGVGWNMFGLNKSRPKNSGSMSGRSSIMSATMSTSSSVMGNKNRIHPEMDPKAVNYVQQQLEQNQGSGQTLPAFYRESAPPLFQEAAPPSPLMQQPPPLMQKPSPPLMQQPPPLMQKPSPPLMQQPPPLMPPQETTPPETTPSTPAPTPPPSRPQSPPSEPVDSEPEQQFAESDNPVADRLTEEEAEKEAALNEKEAARERDEMEELLQDKYNEKVVESAGLLPHKLPMLDPKNQMEDLKEEDEEDEEDDETSIKK